MPTLRSEPVLRQTLTGWGFANVVDVVLQYTIEPDYIFDAVRVTPIPIVEIVGKRARPPCRSKLDHVQLVGN